MSPSGRCLGDPRRIIAEEEQQGRQRLQYEVDAGGALVMMRMTAVGHRRRVYRWLSLVEQSASEFFVRVSKDKRKAKGSCYPRQIAYFYHVLSASSLVGLGCSSNHQHRSTLHSSCLVLHADRSASFARQVLVSRLLFSPVILADAALCTYAFHFLHAWRRAHD